MSQLLTPGQASKILGCTPSQVRRLIKDKKLKAKRQRTRNNQFGYEFLIERNEVLREKKQHNPKQPGYPRGRPRVKNKPVDKKVVKKKKKPKYEVGIKFSL